MRVISQIIKTLVVVRCCSWCCCCCCTSASLCVHRVCVTPPYEPRMFAVNFVSYTSSQRLTTSRLKTLVSTRFPSGLDDVPRSNQNNNIIVTVDRLGFWKKSIMASLTVICLNIFLFFYILRFDIHNLYNVAQYVYMV